MRTKWDIYVNDSESVVIRVEADSFEIDGDGNTLDFFSEEGDLIATINFSYFIAAVRIKE